MADVKSIDGYNFKDEFARSEIAQMKINFQDGVDTIYNAIVAQGITPTASTPSACAAGISDVATSKYNSGRSQGRKDVKSTFATTGVQGAATRQDLTFNTVAGHYYIGLFTMTQQNASYFSIVSIKSGGREVTQRLARASSSYGISGAICLVLIEATANTMIIEKTSSIPTAIELYELGLYE